MLKVIAAAGLLSGTAEGLGSGSAHHESRFAQVAQSLSKDQLAHDAGRLHRPVHPSRGNPSVWFQVTLSFPLFIFITQPIGGLLC